MIAAVVLFALPGEGEEPNDLGPSTTLYEINKNPQACYGSTVTLMVRLAISWGRNTLLAVAPFGVSADDLLR